MLNKQSFKSLIKSSLKTLQLEWVADRLYRRPMSTINFYKKNGVTNVLSSQYGEFSLKQKLQTITPPNYPPIDIKIIFLTGEKYWHQTALCALSLIENLKHIPSFVIYDDGTLKPHRIKFLQRLLTDVSVISIAESEAIVDEVIPREKYPSLRLARDKCIFMRKLIDTNLLSPGRIYLDSDIIFWQYPSELVSLYQEKNPFYMKQNTIPNDWGLICKFQEVSDAIGIEPVHHLNGGIIYLGNAQLDWSLLESWTEILLNMPNQHNFNMVEQTLYSLVVAQQVKDAVGLSDSYYVAFKELPNISTLTHYVYITKFPYMNSEQYRWFRQFQTQ